MWIRKIKINNFKSLVDFELDLAPFNCLIGLNGSGKSTVLQAIDFLAQLVRGDVKEWLRKRRWRAEDLKSHLIDSDSIDFTVEFVSGDRNDPIIWSGEYNINEYFCVVERLESPIMRFKVNNGHLMIKDGSTMQVDQDLLMKYEGSVLSGLSNHIKLMIRQDFAFQNFLERTKSFDALSPYHLRQKAKYSSGSIGFAGEDFSAFFFDLESKKRDRIVSSLRKFYPRLVAVEAISSRSGLKRLRVGETFDGKKYSTESRHVNDGLLRLAALLAMLEDEQNFLSFDEIENGINPEFVELVIEILINAKQQIIVTTHSPMILNFLEDDTARKGVIYLDKRENGTTRATPFFKIPSVDRKLSVMGPGEAFVDTDLLHLADEIDGMAGAE